MKKRALLVAVMVVSLVCIFAGCDFLGNIIGKILPGVSSSLSAPSGLTLEGNTLSWNKVDDATEYEVSIDLNGVTSIKTVTTASYTFEKYECGELSVKVKAKAGSKASDYSEIYSGKLYAKLAVDSSSISVQKNDGNATLTFAAVANATSYSISVKEAAGEWETHSVNAPSFSISDYKKKYSYYFKIQAKGQNYYLDSDVVEYVEDAQPDFSEAPTVYADLKNNSAAIFAASDALRIKVDDVALNERDFAADDSQVSIAFSFLCNLTMGTHEVAVYDETTVYCFYLSLSDTRDPIVAVEPYVKHGNDVVCSVEEFHTSFTNLSVKGLTLSSSYYSMSDGKLTLKATYLDTLLEGSHTFTYNFTRDGSNYSTSFTMTVTTICAYLASTRYVYNGNDDVELSIRTNGDVITKITNGEVTLVANTDYTVGRNSVVIKNSYLGAHSNENFVVYSTKGLSEAFTITYALNGFVPAYSVYYYDKSSGEHLNVEGVLHNNTFKIYGNNITTEDYWTNGTGAVYVSKSYLNTLSAKEHNFMVECEGYYSYFDVKVEDSNAIPYNVKFNFDIDENVYVTFVCDCGKNDHTYKVDDGLTLGCVSPQKLTSFTRSVNHTLTVRCATTSRSTVYEYKKVSEEGIKYMNKRVTVNGKNQDLYVDSLEELAFILKFLHAGGNSVTKDMENPLGKTSIDVYFSSSFIDYISNTEGYFQTALDISGATGIRCNMSGVNNTFTITATYTSAPDASDISGTEKKALTDTRTLIERGDRDESFDAFAIDSYEKAESIMFETELDALPYGVKPVFTENNLAKNVYEYARAICRTYVSDSMSDSEKALVFYRYLASAVTYDTNALTLYEISAEVQKATSLAAAKTMINNRIEKNPSLEGMLRPIENYSSLEDINTYFSTLLNSLRSFRLSGAILDRVAVCDGIASAFKLLCLIEGIPCVKVDGLGKNSGGSEAHAWNKVYIDGAWHIVDATWARLSDYDDDGNLRNAYVNHAYFLIAEEDAIETHVEKAKRLSDVAVVDVLAKGGYDYYANKDNTFVVLGKTYDRHAESKQEFFTTLDLLKSGEDDILEFKLDFEYDDLSKLIKDSNVSCSYYATNGGVFIVLTR